VHRYIDNLPPSQTKRRWKMNLFPHISYEEHLKYSARHKRVAKSSLACTSQNLLLNKLQGSIINGRKQLSNVFVYVFGFLLGDQ
jgi:hypothetical protein